MGKTAWSTGRLPLRSLFSSDVQIPLSNEAGRALRAVTDVLTGPLEAAEYTVELRCEGTLGVSVVCEMSLNKVTGCYDTEELVVVSFSESCGLAQWNASSPLSAQRVASGDRLVEINDLGGTASEIMDAWAARNPLEKTRLRFRRCAATLANEQQISFEMRVWNPDYSGLARFRC